MQTDIRLNYRSSIIILLMTLLHVSPKAQTNISDNTSQRIYMTYKVLEKYHYKPQTLNNDLSQKLNTEFIKTLDPKGLYFLDADIQEFKKWDYRIDDEIIDRSDTYVKQITQTYLNRLKSADSLISDLCKNPFNFKEKDTLFLSFKKNFPNFAKNKQALTNKWKKILKNAILEELYTATEKIKDPYSLSTENLLSNEAEIRKKIEQRYKKAIKKIIDHNDGFQNHVSSIYINSLVALYDPHSTYFTLKDKEEFESSISTTELSFGIHFNENEKGEVEILHLTPGGSAWKSNLLHKGDVVLKIQYENDPLIDFSSVDINEAMDLMSTFKSTQAEFTVRKTNGAIKNIVLTKTKIRSEENVVKSYILNGEKKIGYISLPSFYTELENSNPLGCANDIAKEIVKLQEENIEGLILDIRYNGGGSVREAMGLIGLFINEGPLCIYKSRIDKPYLLKDMNRGTAYDAPLAIMINGMSASASEIVSASLQDYNRAIIVGSSSYGKATGQIIIPLDTTYNIQEVMAGMNQHIKNDLGYIKITTEGFYRITNATHQKKGVQPDIKLLEPFYFENYKEMANTYALSNDSIIKKVVYSPLPPLPINNISESSVKRIKQKKNFIRLQSINDSLYALSKNEVSFILSPEFYKKSEKKYDEITQEMEKCMYDSTASYQAINNLYDKQLIDFDEYTKEINQRSLSTIQSDIYIEETYYIISDLINFIKN